MSFGHQNTEQSHVEHIASNPLPLQKQALKNAILNYIAAAVLFFSFSVIMFNVIFNAVFRCNETLRQNSGSLFGAFLLSFGSLCFGIFAIQRYAILKQLEAVEGSTVYTISTRCRQVRCIGQIMTKRSAIILCLVLTDENGSKFCYVYPKGNAPPDTAKASIKAQYLGNRIELCCYHDTNMIKTLTVSSCSNDRYE